ncbi:hypothetical protein VTL71DRAFT_13174 [Oculimacula yallundae]|uniref:Secreted protein n=1 Tax=Oculimacula yallundae TaxID=86028 RepID=A0ABR4CLP5_9HELO
MYKVLASVLATCAVVGASPLALATRAEAPVSGYGIEEVSWLIPASASGPEVVLNGTIQQVYSQLLDINPGYQAEIEAAIPSSQVAARGLEKRGDVHCGGFANAATFRIREGISYLRGVGGNPVAGPGPGNCARVSCSWSAAIWWCNDNSFTKVLPGFYNIADGAEEIVNTCDHEGFQVAGQDFIGGARDWNVIVRKGDC